MNGFAPPSGASVDQLVEYGGEVGVGHCVDDGSEALFERGRDRHQRLPRVLHKRQVALKLRGGR